MRRLSLLLLFLCWLPAARAGGLADSPSPYLRMHAGDPVQWRAWGPEVLEEAQRLGRPIFISSGYFACHWCHVMHRESFRDPAIARLLNEHFIPVKVDRELDPALDEHLVDFVRRTRGHAGWPLNVFLTPEGYPVTGATYLPPEQFRTVLERLRDLWTARRAEVTDLARRALDLLVEARREGASAAAVPGSGQLEQRFVEAALERADEISGGFGQQNKFPMQPQLMALLQVDGGARRQEVEAFVRLTLDEMAARGLRDHLGGGFFRYTVDPQWTVPHFEKMLYTQALLSLLYLEAADRLGRPAYRQVAFDTLDFVVREMAGRDGGFVASLSAVDDRGVEGGYYLWSREALERLLAPEERALAFARWTFEPAGEGLLPLRGKDAAVLAAESGRDRVEVERLLQQVRKKLLAARSRRGLPVDDKQLAGWNGLLLAAFARAVQAEGGERFRRAGTALAHYLIRHHWDGAQLRRVPGGAPGTLEDHAWVALGLWRWSRVAGDAEAGRLARKLVRLAWEGFRDQSGWRSARRPLLPGMPAAEAQEDGALPAPAAAVLELSLEEPALAGRARKALLAARSRVRAEPFWYPSFLLLLLHSG